MNIKLNSSGTRIDNDAGDYLVLVDYGIEGMCLDGQFSDLKDAIDCRDECSHSPTAVVKLVSVEASEA